MASAQTIWGIDVGRAALKAVKLRVVGDGKVEVVAHDYIEHAKILSQPDADRDELISNALEKFLSRNDLSRDRVVVGVPGQQTLARFTKLPPVKPNKIPDIVRYEADQQIPFDMDEVIWDFQTFQEEDLPDVEVGIFAMKRELVREHLLHFEQAAIEPVAVQSGPLAVYNAAYFDGWLGDQTTILLDVGAENTDVIIATKNNLWTRSIAIGGNNLTEALVKSFSLSFSKAEHLKRNAKTSKYARQVFQAMRPVFSDLVQELQRSIGFYSSTHREAEIEKIVIVGNALKLSGLQKYLQQNLGLPVERPDAFANTVESSVSAAPQFKEELLSFVVPYGLALQGLDQGKVTSNLLPTELAKQVVWAKKKPIFAAAAACLLLAGGTLWFRQYSDMSAVAPDDGGRMPRPTLEQAVAIIRGGPTVTDPRAQAEQVIQAGQTVKSELGKLQNEGKTEVEVMDRLISWQKSKQTVPAVFNVIHSSLPQVETPIGEISSPGKLKAQLAAFQPRDKREIVTIERLDMEFHDSLYQVTDRFDYPLFQADAEDFVFDIPNNSEDIPGFVVNVRVRTPNADGAQFVRKTFLNKLREIGRKPGRGWYVNRAIVISQMKEEEAQQLARGGGGAGGGPGGGRPVGRPGAGPAGGGRGPGRGLAGVPGRSRGRGGRGPGAMAPGQSSGGDMNQAEGFDVQVAKEVDPVTGEPQLSDYVVDCVIELIFKELPEDFDPTHPGQPEDAAAAGSPAPAGGGNNMTTEKAKALMGTAHEEGRGR